MHRTRRPALAARPHRTLRRSPRAVWRMLRLTPLGAGVAVLAGLPAISAWAQTAGVAANVIKPDGRTATQQQVMGTRTDITTGTVKGDNAFNSFSRFEVGQGQTVNVHVPTAAQRVINIVTDAPVKVDGVLNGLKDGSISGNLVFADPMGMVVSKGGVVNVNSLQVVATTRAHADAMLDGQGRIGDAAVQQLLDGKAPRSAEGRVQIDGKINALERVRIEARRIDVDGRIKAGADAAHDAAFRAAVSSNGLANATGMVERGGVIELVGDDAVHVAGTLDASQRQALAAPEAPQAGVGGTVKLLADSIELAPTAHIDVSGLTGGGVALIGSMSVPAASADTANAAAATPEAPVTQTLVAATGSVVQADAIERGDGGRIQYLSDGSTDWGGTGSSRGGALMGHGGFVEVSGRRRVQLHGLVDTTAPKGDTGTLLIDPDDLTIVNGANATNGGNCLANGSSGACSVTTGTIANLAASSNLVLQADNSITLGGSDGSAATLDLSSALNSSTRGISFTSKDITFNANSRLVTGGGFVKLVALGGQSTGELGTGRFSYDSSIGIGPLSIGQQVKGGTLRMKAGSAIVTRGVASGDAATAALVRNAGDVTLRGATVQMDAGSSILAQAESGSNFTGGAVELTAYSLQQWNLGKATAISQMTLAGTVKANAISVNAVARAEASPDGVWGYAIQAIQTSIGALTGMNAGYHETQADATIEVQGTAVLDAKTTLDIAAASVNKAAGSVKVFTVDANGNNIASAAAIFVKTAGQANLQVRGNAQLTSGGKTTLGAYNDATAKSSVKVLSNNSIGGVVVGYMAADVSANANVEAGAKLNVGSLELAALQTGNMRNQAASTVAQQEQQPGQPAPATASIGASVAISDIKAHATANLGASLTNVGDVTVVADSSLWQNFIAARNDVGGDPTIGDKVQMAIAAKLLPFASQQGKLTAWLADKFDALGNLAKGSPPIKAGAVITVNETDLDAKAHIGNGAQITSSGQVAVVAQTEDRSVHNVAESKVNTKNSPNAAPVVNAAAAVGLYKHGAEATVGENAVINAKVFGSYADVYQPLDVTWLAGFSTDGLRDPGELFKHFAPPNFGMPQFVFTSWATALSEQADIKDANGNDTIAVAGSVNWTSFTNTARSWVGSGAKITTTDADRAWSVSWKAPTAPLLDGDQTMSGEPANAASNILLETQDAVHTVSSLTKNAVGEITGFFNGGPTVLGITLRNSLSFEKALDVKARNQSAFLTFTGQPVDFGMTSVNLGSQGGKAAVGGAFNYAGAEHTTVAGIDDGAVVKATAGTVSVDALSQDRIISVAPTAGTGKGYAANLIAAYSELDNTTVAVVSNKADVQAKVLAVNATEDVSVWSAAGAAAYGASTAAIGLAVAVNELDGRTLATIGNPGALSVGQVRPSGFSGASGTGAIDAPVVNVRGLTQGTSGALAASASSATTEDPNQNQNQDADKDKQIEKDDKSALSKKWEALKSSTSALREAAVTKLLTTDTGKIASLRNTLAGKIQAKEDASAPEKPYQTTKFSLSAAGSATVNLGNLDTSSVIDAAALQNKTAKPAGAADASVLDVRAVNDTHQYSVSGSLALLKLNAPQTQSGYGVSGAIAIDLENNDTLARITDTAVKDYGNVTVESLASGQRISAGLGIAGSSGAKPAYMLSASYSMTDSDNSTKAAIEGGKISSSSDAFRTDVDVLSYDKTETGVGAGALTVQTNKAKGGAAGASIGVALVHNEVESRIAGMDSDKLSTVDVRAYDPVVLGIGAASLGIATDKKSSTIEGSVTYGEVENTTRALITDRNNIGSTIKAAGAVTVQATDVTPDAFKTRFTSILAGDGTPAGDSTYDFGASLRTGDQESFGGQSIGTSQPGALVIGVAGGIAVTAGNSVGASAALSRVASVHESLVEGATVNADSVKVDATDATLMVNVGIGVAGTGTKTALAGSVALTIDDTRATARVGTSGKTTSVTTTGSGGLGVTSATSDKAFAFAGAVGISTKGSAGGIAGTVGVDGSVSEAQIQSATVNTGTAATRVQGSTSSQHVSVAAAGGYGANASINGSFVINFETARTTASISDSGITAASLAVKAGDDAALASQVYTGSGSLGFSKDVAGGAALTSNTVALTRDATIDRATLTLGSGTLEVQADSSVKMIGVTIAGGGSKDVAFNGAISSNEIANKTTARVAGSTVTTTGDVSVLAGDRSEMDYGTGAVSVSGATAIGAAIAFNLVTNDVTAQVQGTDANGLARGTGVVNAGNLRVGASSDEKIVNAAYGVAIGSEVGGAGSVAVNVIDSDVTAHVGRGADIHADGTVAVTATAQDDIKSFGGALGLGSGAGVGLSSTVNVVRGATEASVGADDEAVVKLDAKGNGAGLAVNSGTLTQAMPGVVAPGSDPGGFDGMAAMKDYDVTRAKMAEGTTTVKGLAVNATSLRHVLSFDTNAGGSEDGVGIGANAGAHVISSKTTADIANASVNQRDTGNAAQDVAVKSSSHHAMSTFGFSAGGSSGGGGAGALGGDVFLTQTTAQVRDSQVKAAGDVTVKAGNESAQSGILAGIAAAGGGSIAGSTGVIVFDAGVEASILGGTTRAGDDVAVNAGNTSVMNTITGAGALSGGLALSGAVTVLVADLATHAYIGRDTDSGQPTKVSSGGDVEVKADSTTQVNTFTFAISGGAATSVAAIGAVGVITNDTAASARHADLAVGVPANWVYAASTSGPGTGSVGESSGNNGTVSGAPTGTLTVAATDHGVVNQVSGAAGINFVAGGGVGGTVSVMVAKSNVSADVKSSEVDTKDLGVTSLNSQDQLAATVGVGGAADVGAGFAISLTMTGTGSPGADAFGNASDSNSLGTKLMDRASSIASANRLGETAGTLSASDRATLQSQSSRDISKTLTNAGANSAAAFIDGSVVRADRDVTVKAGQETALKNIAGAAGVGGIAGIGGTVGVSVVHNASAAQVTGSNITAGGALQVKADSADKGNKHALDLLTIAGGAGFAGLGASVGVGQLENQVSAQASGTLKAGSISLTATDSTSARAENVAAAAGAGAVGIAVSTLERSGTVQAWVNKAGASGQSIDAGSLSISAGTTQDNDVISRAVAAGMVGSGNGAAGTIDDTVGVSAGIGDGSAIHVGGSDAAAGRAVTVTATRGATLDSGAEGVGVSGGVQIGASVAIARMGGYTEAKVGNNVTFDAGGTLAVVASEDAGNTVNAAGSASGGGTLVGANATVAQSENTAQVRASIGDGTLLPDGAVAVHATHAGTQHAESFGVTVGGLLALGANTSDAKTSAATSATLGNVRTSAKRLGDLDVAAQGLDVTTAKAVAGGGGLVSGQAATALVTDTTSTTATIAAAGATALANAADYTLRGGALTVDATHAAQVRADADTVNASAVGASGAITLTELNNSAIASIGDGVRLRGLGIALTSSNLGNETGSGDNAAGAGGGVANGSAVVAKTHFVTQSSSTVGNNAKLDVVGDPSSDLVGRLVIVAGTDLATHTQGSLNTGGVIDIPYAEIESTTDAKNNVTLGTGAELRSAGDLVLGTSVLNRTSAAALVKTYGGIGITGAKSTANARQTDRIQLSTNALLQAYGNVSIATGRNADNAVNLMQSKAVTDVYNNTAVPISYQNPANANITQDSGLSLATGSQVLAGRSVYLRTFKGDQLVSAAGEGHNPYLDLFSTSTSDSNPSQSFTGSAALNGTVTAGYYRLRDLTIDRSGTLSQRVDTADNTLPVLTFTMDAAGVYRNAAGQVVDASAVLKPQGYIAKVDGFNPNLYYDANAKTKLGGVPNAAMGAYVLPDLVVAGGNVEVDATTVSGNGTLRAQGGPMIKVDNQSNRYLIANTLVIPDIDSGGGVTFTGSGAKPASLAVQQVDKGRVPTIDLHNSYDTAFGGLASDIVLQASSTGGGANTVRNLRGSFRMVNDNGNVWGSAPEALTVDIQVPKGTYVIESYGYEPIGGAPQGTWAATDALFRPNDIGSFVDTAAYAFYVANFSNPSTTNSTYSYQLQGIVNNGGNGGTGYLFRANLGNQPTSGGNWYGGRYNFDILPVKTLSSTRSGTPVGATKSPGLLANRVDITAAYIDINADIRAGTARDIDVTITNAKPFSQLGWLGGTAMSFFDCVADNTCRNFNGLYAEANGLYKVPAAALSYGANSPQLTVTYDPSTRRVSTAPIGTASVGAISLIGRILNSNADGSARSKIELSTGTLQLNVNNQSGYAFEMPRIETGGASGDGVIRITDLNKLNAQYKPLTSWWVSSNGTDVKLYQSFTASTYNDPLNPLTPITSGNGAATGTYDPQAGWRYEWTRSASASRSFTHPTGANAWWDYYATPWTFAYGASTPTWNVYGASPVYAPGTTAAYATQLSQSTGFSGAWNVTYSANGPAQRYWNIATNITLYQQSSVRADYGMDISFKGYASGGVTFTSNADTYLGTTLNNPTGDTTLTLTNGASLIARDGALIRSRNLTLNAAGNIGGTGQSKALDLDASGWLNAHSGGNMALNAAGNLTLARADVGDGKQLRLKAVGDITTTSNAVTLTGYDVDLTSVGGRIGGAGTSGAMNVNVKGIGSSVSQRGLLTASSSGDISLNLTGGDTRVAALTAADGNVTLVTNGSLFDAREAQGTSGRTDTELQQLWEQTLKISGSKTASVQDYLQHTITPMDQQVNRAYRDYWALRGLGQLNGAGTHITLNATGLATLRAQTAAALGVATPSDAQVNQWANTLLGRYADTFGRMLGSSWRNLAAFQSQDSSYRFSADRYNEYWTLRNATDSNHQLTAAGRDAIRQVAATVIGGTPTDAQLQAYADQRLSKLATDFAAALGSGWASQAAFTTYQADYRLAADTLLNTYAFGTYWGTERLQNEIRATAFGNASTGSSTSIDHLNISGRRVSLKSTAANATLGRDNGYLTVTLGQPLSDMQRYALAQASAPGDVQVITNGAGQITGLKVKDTRPFFVDAKGQFDAFAEGQLYVLAQGALAIGGVQSAGALRLSAHDGITNAGTALAIKGSSLVLDAGNGSLGASASPLLINTPELSLARASGSIYLRQPSGNLVIDVVGAGHDVVLTLNSGSLSQKQPDLLSLAGESLTLNVSGNVGSAARPLVLQARSGPLTLNATDAWINATGNELLVGDSSLRNFTLRALGSTDVEVAGNVLSDDVLTWLIGGDFVVDTGKQLRSRGDLTLTASSVDMASGSGLVTTNGALALYSTAGPAVLSTLTARTGMTVDSELAAIRTRDANVTFTVQNAGGSLKFNSLNNAGGGIGGVAGGDTSAALRVAADRVSVRSANGDASLRLLGGNVTIDNAALAAGSLKLDAAGALSLASGASAGQDLTLAAAQGLTLAAGRTASAGRNLAMQAASLTLGTGSRATAGDSATLLARSGNAALATVQVANSLAIDAANGVISQASTTDQFAATAANGRIALNAGNTGGLGLGSAAVPLRLSADRVSARTASGNVQLALLKATALERALANTGDVTLTATGNLTATGDVNAAGNTRVTVDGQFVAAGSIGAGQDLTLRANALDLAGALQAGRDATLTATAGDLRIRDRLAANGNTTLTASAALLASDVRTGGDLGLNAGHADAGHLAAGGQLTLAATSAQLGDATTTGDATLATTGALDITGTAGLNSGGATRITAGGLAATRIVSAGSVDLTAGATRIDTLGTQHDARLAVQSLDLSQATIAGQFALTAGSADLGQLTVGGDAQLAATGTVTLANLAARRVDASADALYLAQLALRDDAHLRATRHLRVDNGTTGTTLDLQAGQLQLGTLRSGGNATLAATGLLDLASLTSAGTASLAATTLAAGRLEAARDVDVNARIVSVASLASHANARITAPDSLTLDAATVDGNLTVNADTAHLGTLDVGRSATLDATGALTLAALNAERLALAADQAAVAQLALRADATLRVAHALRLDAATTGTTLDLRAASAQLGTLLSTGNATLATTGAMALTGLATTGTATVTADALTAGRIESTGNAALAANGTMTLTQLTAGGTVDLTADTLTAGRIEATGITTLAARTMDVTTLQAGADAQLNAAQSLALGTATVAGQLAVATGNATLGSVHAVGDATLQATGALRLDAGTFDANLVTTADTATLGQVQVAGAADLRTAGLLKLDTLDVGRTLAATAGSIDGTRLSTGGNASLAAAGDVTLANGDFGADLQLAANSGSATLGTLSTGRNAALSANSAMTLTQLTAGGTFGLTADTLSAGRIASAGITTLAARTMDVATLQADADAQLNAAQSLALGTATVAGQLAIATGTATLGSVHAVGDTTLQATGALRLDAGTFDANLGITADTATLGQVQVAGAADLRTTGLLKLDTLDIGRTLAATAGSIDGTHLSTGGNATLAASGDVTLANGDFGADLQLAANAARLGTWAVAGNSTFALRNGVSLDRLAAAGNLDLHATQLDIGTLTVGADARLATPGALRLDDGRIAGTLTLAASDATLGTLQAGGDATLQVSGTLRVDHSVSAGRALSLQADALQAGQLAAGTTLAATARVADVAGVTAGAGMALNGGTLNLGTASAAQAITVTADALAAQRLAAGGSLAVQAGDVQVDALSSGGDATLASGSRLAVGSATVGGSLSAQAVDARLAGLDVAGNGTLAATQGLTLNGSNAFAGSVQASAADIAIDSATFGGATRLTAANTLQAHALTARDALQLAADSATLDRVTVAGALDVTTAHGLTLNQLAAQGTTRLRSGALLGSDWTTAALSVDAASATLSHVAASGDVDVTVAGALALQGTSSFQSNLTANAAQLAVDTASVGGNARLDSSGSAVIAQLQTGGSAVVRAVGDLTLRQLTAADADLAAHAMALTTVQVSHGLQATAAQDLVAGQLVAGQALTLQSGGQVQAQLVNAPVVSIDAGRDVTLNLLKTGTGTLRSATQVAIANGQANVLDLQAARIQGTLKANEEALITALTGVGGGTADNVALAVQAQRWQIPVLDTANAQFSSSGSYAQFDQVHLTGRMMLTTPQGLVGITAGTVKVLPNVDIQLFSRSGDFVLTRDGVMAYTSALGLLEKPGQRIAAPNSGLMPLAATGNGKGPKAGPAAQPSQQAINFDALLRRAPTSAGEDEDDGLVGTLEF